jgi:hypothetical protein
MFTGVLGRKDREKGQIGNGFVMSGRKTLRQDARQGASEKASSYPDPRKSEIATVRMQARFSGAGAGRWCAFFSSA